MNYYDEIKNKLIENEIYNKVKDYSKERNKIMTYFEIGKLLSEAGKEYGDDIIGRYSKRLMNEVGRKYDKSTLFKMRKFYHIFSNEKMAPLAPQLNWSHCLLLLPIKDINKINYYIGEISKRNFSERQLQKAITSNEYDRLPENAKLSVLSKMRGLYNDPEMIEVIMGIRRCGKSSLLENHY